jgi:cullin 3
MHLIPLIKSKLLLKNPSQNSFGLEDKISVNLDYKSSLLRNKISVLVSKNVKEQDNFRVQGKVEDDRRYQIEAAIIKVMKARRQIDNTNLIMETTKHLLIRFKPEPAQIKQRIEQLIERGYIERDEEDKRIFKYIA